LNANSICSGFAGNDSPSFVFPTAIATKGPTGGSGGSGSGRPAVANKPSFLTGGAGPSGHLSGKRGTEDLDFFIGEEALAAAAGPGMPKRSRYLAFLIFSRLWNTLSNTAWSDRKLGEI
jgi:actin-related protein